jgi:hypothetical protein
VADRGQNGIDRVAVSTQQGDCAQPDRRSSGARSRVMREYCLQPKDRRRYVAATDSAKVGRTAWQV